MLKEIAYLIQKSVEKHCPILVFNFQEHKSDYGDYIAISYVLADKSFNKGSRKILVLKEGGDYIITDEDMISSGIPLKYDSLKPRAEKDTEKMFSVFYRFQDEVGCPNGTEFLMTLKNNDLEKIEDYITNLETIIKRLLEA